MSDIFGTKNAGQPLEERIEIQALSVDLREAVMACLCGGESRRWTIAELVERFKNLGVSASRASVTAALAELGRSESRSDSLSYRARPFDFKLATLPILRLIDGLTFETRIFFRLRLRM